MTVSLFATYERRIAATEAERMMHAAQAALYPHVTHEGARKLWSGWAEQINRVAREAAVQTRSLFTVNGESVGVDGLRRWFRKVLGKRAEVA